jgi:hypothetical protein
MLRYSAVSIYMCRLQGVACAVGLGSAAMIRVCEDPWHQMACFSVRNRTGVVLTLHRVGLNCHSSVFRVV